METTAEGQRRGPAGPPRETPQEESRLDLVVWSPPLTVELSKFSCSARGAHNKRP
jgi:hypothetical protein